MRLFDLTRTPTKTTIDLPPSQNTIPESLTLRLEAAYLAEELNIDEGIANWIMALGLSSIIAGGMGAAVDYLKSKAPDQITKSLNQPAKTTKDYLVANLKLKPLEKTLLVAAANAGLDGPELKQFMAQCAHETANWSTLEEFGTDRYFLKNYDIKHNPRKARVLGNLKPGDGLRYKGRGYIQLTGKDNYARASKALYGDDRLVRTPELVADPKVAAETSIWFWKHRVQPKVTDFTDTSAATKPINPGLKGLSDRETKYSKYANAVTQPSQGT